MKAGGGLPLGLWFDGVVELRGGRSIEDLFVELMVKYAG